VQGYAFKNMNNIEINYSAIFIISITALLIFFVFYKKHIINILDPILLNGTLACLYISGAIYYYIIINTNNLNTIIIISCIIIVLITPSVIVKRADIIYKITPNKENDAIIFYLGVIDLILLTNIVINYIYGSIPFLQGTEARARLGDAVSSTLVLVAPYLGIVCLTSLFYNSLRLPRLLSKFGIILYIITVFLNGSKAAILGLTQVYLFYLFISSVKIQKNNTYTIQKIASIKNIIKAFVIIVTSMSYYFSVTNTENYNELLNNFGYRLFTGLDVVILSDMHNINLLDKNLNVIEFYLYPILNKLGIVPEFRSAGHFVSSVVFGKIVADTGLNPNSNLVVEWVGSIGLILGCTISTLVLVTTIYFRSYIYKRKVFKIFDLFLISVLMQNPFAPFFDGAYFFIMLYELLAIYIIIYILYIIIKRPKYLRLV